MNNIYTRWLITTCLVGLAFLFGFDAGKHQGREEGRAEQLKISNEDSQQFTAYLRAHPRMAPAD